MKRLFTIISLLTAFTLVACQGSGGGGGSSVDMSKLNGSWQATYFKDGKSGVEAKDDGSGYLVMPGSSGGSTSSSPTYMKLFVTFDGSKLKTTIVARDFNYSNESSADYRVDGNTLVSKSTNSDGTSKEDRAQVTSLNQDIFEIKDDKGTISKFKRVTDAAIQSAKTSVPGSSSPNNNGCVPQQGLSCTTKPGLSQGQVFNLQTDLNLVEHTYNYFVNGQSIQKSDLVKREGQDFCMITVASKYSNPQELELPKEYQKNGIDQLPKVANPYILAEISWYVESVFFKGKTPSGEAAEFVVYCGIVQNGDTGSKQQTSLAAIQKHLAGIISLQQ